MSALIAAQKKTATRTKSKSRKTTRKARLTLPSSGAKQASVAGDFNGWQPQPLEFLGDGIWSINLDLQPGTYEYLFLVDEQWMPDPACIETKANPYGGENSVLRV